MSKQILNDLTLEELRELEWAIGSQQGSRVTRLCFDRIIKRGIVLKLFGLMTESDCFYKLDVKREIESRSANLF
jgi:hypothetical protein